jgi:hypothetical protein
MGSAYCVEMEPKIRNDPKIPCKKELNHGVLRGCAFERVERACGR